MNPKNKEMIGEVIGAAIAFILFFAHPLLGLLVGGCLFAYIWNKNNRKGTQ